MEARSRLVLILVLVVPGLGASARTKNFVVVAPTPALASEIAQAAEQMRSELAIEWLGHTLPDWQQPCPVVAKVDEGLGAGGRTSFMFRDRVPFGWDMEVQGSRERILDSVLPHEVTHTIFATHFGCPLPRWADEGACTTVEHSSERLKQEKWLLRFLRSERGIPFNHMFAMKEYPGDIIPLYSQGYSVARYLIAQGGKPKFVEFVGSGLQTNSWTHAVRQFYGFESLGDLQLSWLDWVATGSSELPSTPPTDDSVKLASAAVAVPRSQQAPALATGSRRGPRPKIDVKDGETVASAEHVAQSDATPTRNWYVRRQQVKRLVGTDNDAR